MYVIFGLEGRVYDEMFSMPPRGSNLTKKFLFSNLFQFNIVG